MDIVSPQNKYKFRTIWISDTHLGTKHCHADSLLEFLSATESEYLYLVGDIVDLWAMKKNIFWPPEHTQVLQLIQNLSDTGTKVIYTPGNHDSALRLFCGNKIGNIQVEKSIKHTTKDGRELLVIHGDQVDTLMQAHFGNWLSYVGDVGYDFLLFMNSHMGRIRRLFGLKYWSLAKFIKNNIKNAMKHVSTYESLLASLASEQNVNGVVCGHIHFPRTYEINGIEYFNTGDWVENCTALAETTTGEIKLIYWSEMINEISNESMVA